MSDIFASVSMVFFDFDGVFTDNRVLVSDDGKESVQCYRSDGIGLEKLRKLGIECMVISAETNPVVSERCRKLKIDCIQGCKNKLEAMKKILDEKKIMAQECIFVGNDDGDLECMQYIGFSVAVADAYPIIKRNALIILDRKGGYGAVRELCELVVADKLINE